MTIRIDGDACPSIKLIETVAQKYHKKMIIYADYTHQISSDYADIVLLDKSSQSVDMEIVKQVEKNDIVVTQDFGLASMILAKDAYPVGPKGLIYTNDNMETLLAERFINGQIRKANKRNKGPKKRTKEDDENLINSIETLLKKEI